MVARGVADDEGVERSGVWHLVALGAILAVAVVLRGYRLSEPIAGFLAFSEAYYLQRAAVEAERGIFQWFTDPAFPNVFPLYLLLVTTVERVGTATIGAARALSVTAGTLTVLVTYYLGELVHGRRAGLLAAATLAVMPGAVLLNHNAQVDSLMVLLVVSSVYLYARSVRLRDTRWAVAAGAVGGLAVMAKLPALLLVLAILALWETWGSRGFGWLRKPRARWFLSAFLPVGLSWYAWQTLASSGRYTNSMSQLGSRATGGNFEFLSWGPAEVMWLLSPGVTIALAVALVFALRRGNAGDKLAAAGVAVTIAFFVVFHFHSYYLLPLAPFAALMVGGGLDSLADRSGVGAVGVGTTLALTTAVAAFLLMSGQKWGQWSAEGLVEVLEERGASHTVFMTDPVGGSIKPPVEYYIGEDRTGILPADVYDPADAGLPAEDSLVLSVELTDQQGNHPPTAADLTRESLELVLFGVAFSQVPPSVHQFANGRWQLSAVGPAWWVGVRATEKPAEYVLYDPADL